MYRTENLVKDLVAVHGNKRDALLPILQGVAEKYNYLTDDVMVEVAKELEISAAEVYGTASFYTFLDTEPRGEYVVRVCKTITCSMKERMRFLKPLKICLKLRLVKQPLTENSVFWRPIAWDGVIRPLQC